MTHTTHTKGVRGHKKKREGIVLKSNMKKTIVVKVMRLAQHARYKKYIKASKKYYVHDEEGKAKVGDKVRIVESKPMSKLKRWRLTEVL
ncbi:MAG: 30S ribosomal protein S17 [Candidatus Omnitrophica bacterium]|nr:30S ribosomal protein S17 [Candidatus Omnitrophota bacterium]